MTEPLNRDQRDDTPSSTQTSPHLRKTRTTRAALLGAVAVVALGGAFGNSLLPHGALAEAPALTVPGQSSGPASFADIVDRVKGSVVAVKVKMVETADASDDNSAGIPQLQPGDPLEKFFKRFGGEGLPFQFRGPQQRHSGQALGSGFIISADGYVVTNNHVVEHASDVSITLDDGRTLPAKVVGTDKKTDLALLKVNDGNNLPYVNFATKEPRIGDWVLAVGNPFGLGGTVTAGIVSARGRDIGAGPYDDFLQIDAPVNRGNSGGPTFDTQGNVVGVNTAIYSPSGGSVGIGFAIPAEVAKDVVASLKEKGTVSRGWIGVQIQPVNPDIADSLNLKNTKGALVAETQSGSPAASAGLKSGDVDRCGQWRAHRWPARARAPHRRSWSGQAGRPDLCPRRRRAHRQCSARHLAGREGGAERHAGERRTDLARQSRPVAGSGFGCLRSQGRCGRHASRSRRRCRPKGPALRRYHSRSRRPSGEPAQRNFLRSRQRQEGRPQGSPAARQDRRSDPLRRAGNQSGLLRSGSSAGGERRATPPFGVHGRQVGISPACRFFRGTAI